MKITLSAERIEGRPDLPAGVYQFRVDGFRPLPAKSGSGSVNLRPSMKVANNADLKLNGVYMPWFNMNTSADWLIVDFVHSLGMDLNADLSIPGDFTGPDDKPADWKYTGPMLNATGMAEVMLKAQTDEDKAAKKKPEAEILRFICQLPNCQHKHTADIR